MGKKGEATATAEAKTGMEGKNLEGEQGKVHHTSTGGFAKSTKGAS
jgi:hypothetical protein